jgi:hypothetical protein
MRLDRPLYTVDREVAEELHRVTVRKSIARHCFVTCVSLPEGLSHATVGTGTKQVENSMVQFVSYRLWL